jgi:hypothetical protein
MALQIPFVMNKSSMRKRNFMIWFMMLGLYFSCAGPGQSPQRGGKTVDYSEDLSFLRRSEEFKAADTETATTAPTPTEGRLPAGTGTITTQHDVTNELETLLAESAEENKKIKNIPGFTIQVYLGTSREAANKAQRQVYMAVPEARPEIKFVQPNYRVFVGRFVERMEAQQTYAAIKKEFPNALIIPDRIQINE